MVRPRTSVRASGLAIAVEDGITCKEAVRNTHFAHTTVSQRREQFSVYNTWLSGNQFVIANFHTTSVYGHVVLDYV